MASRKVKIRNQNKILEEQAKILVPGKMYLFYTYREGFIIGMFLKMDKVFHEVLILSCDGYPELNGKIRSLDAESWRSYDFYLTKHK